MNRRRILLIAATALAVAILTFLLTRTAFIQEVIAPPIYIVYLVLVTFFGSLPQLLFWLIFMIFVLQVLLTGLLQLIGTWLGQRQRNKPAKAEVMPGSVETYTRWIEQEHLGPFFKWRLRQRVMELGLRTIGRNESIPLAQLERNLQDNTFNLPEDVVRYLKDGIDARENDRKPRSRTFLPRSGKSQVDHADLIAMLDYLEEVLEQ
jgi:hypothetical protein